MHRLSGDQIFIVIKIYASVSHSGLDFSQKATDGLNGKLRKKKKNTDMTHISLVTLS